MIWNRYSMASAAISLGLTASLVSYQAVYAVRARNYTIREMRAVLNGFGYNVPLGDTLDQATTDAIREFQRGYKLPIDGTPGPQTQDLMADLVGILQANLNLVVKPSSPLPRNQFYGPLTEAIVRQYQQKAGLPVTGIATLAMRQRLDQEAERMLNNQSAPSVPGTRSQPTPSPSPSPSPTPTPRATPTPTPVNTTSNTYSFTRVNTRADTHSHTPVNTTSNTYSFTHVNTTADTHPITHVNTKQSQPLGLLLPLLACLLR